MELEHQDILGVVFIGQLALLDSGAEAAGDVGVAGVGSVAVDVRLDAAFARSSCPQSPPAGPAQTVKSV